ncbi:MAG: NAD-dependent epimerase/dehydratase family protein [Oscillospiraceae bacterium]
MNIIYLVTGGAGHLGNTIVRLLCEQKKHVRVLVLKNDATAENLTPEVEIFYGDVTDKASMREFFTIPIGFEAIVIHSAGIVTIASKFNRRVFDVNVSGTKNIVDMCVENRVKRLVHVSSVHAIPELEKGVAISEISAFNPENVIGLYAKTKSEATEYVLQAAKKGLDACVVHPSGISGPYDYGHGHLTQLLIDYCNGTLTAGVNGGYDFVDVRDVALGIIACCEKGRSGECYILSNRYFSIRELFDIFYKVTGKHKIKTILPMWFAKGTAALSELYYKLRKQPPLYTAYSLYTLSSNANFSNEKAKRELGFTNRPFEETVADAVDWLTEQGRIKPVKHTHRDKTSSNKSSQA